MGFSEMHEVQARQRMSDETFLQGFTELENRQRNFELSIGQQLNELISLLGGQAKPLPAARGSGAGEVSGEMGYHDISDWPAENDLSFSMVKSKGSRGRVPAEEEMHHF